MMKKLFKFLFVSGFIFGIVCVVGYFSAKYFLTQKAIIKSEEIISSIPKSNAQKELIDITREVYKRFRPQEPSQVPALRVRPYITNAKLPEAIKFQNGVIETLVETGLCDNAARYLHFVLKQKGYKSVQWNMITDRRAHSALLVYFGDNQTALLDPMYGVIGYDKLHETLLSPKNIKDRIQNGEDTKDIFLTLDENSNLEFYHDFAEVRMAAIGDPLEIKVDLPYAQDGYLFLGALDNDYKDVYKTSAANNMTPFWHYAGHKYDRSWVRILNIHQDIRLEFILTNDVDDTVLTTDIEPQIDGNKMIWDLKTGDALTFYDGRAKRSFKRMNSFIPVDQIAIYPK